jgi:UPF0716 protein FxsA
MRLAFIALLMVLPLLEIALLVKFGQWAGVWLTLAEVIGSAVAGVGILQRQGLTMFMRTQEAVMRGEPPVGAMLEGGMLVMAGTLLIMPGLITDSMGLLLLIPAVRQLLAGRMVAGMFGGATVRVDTFEDDPRREPGSETRARDEQRPGDGGGPVIEGDFERLDERTVDPRKNPPRNKS